MVSAFAQPAAHVAAVVRAEGGATDNAKEGTVRADGQVRRTRSPAD
jgi:hypothetical protein